jgi:hypothetical protein
MDSCAVDPTIGRRLTLIPAIQAAVPSSSPTPNGLAKQSRELA